MQNKHKNFFLILWLFLASLNFNLILKPLNLVTGGTQGVAILISHKININPSSIVFLINITMLIISYFFLPKSDTYSALLSSFIYPLCIKITSFINISFNETNILILSIIAGIICGITGGFIYKMNFSSGGITIINSLLQQYCHIKIAISNFIINGLIIILGYYSFGQTKTIYSLIVIFLGSIIINKILDKRKNFHYQ